MGPQNIALFQVTARVRTKRSKIRNTHRVRMPQGIRICRAPKSGSARFRCILADGMFYNLQHMPISCLSSPYQKFPRFIDALSRSVVVFIVRDPRDVAVSLAHYLASQTDYHITTSLFREMPVSRTRGPGYYRRLSHSDLSQPISEPERQYSRAASHIPRMVRCISERLAFAIRGHHRRGRRLRYRTPAANNLATATRSPRARPTRRLP